MKSLSYATIAVIFVSTPAARALPADESIRLYLRARSAAQLAKTELQTRRARRLELICDAELRGKRVPITCFKLLAGEVGPRNDQSWLTDLCAARARDSADRSELGKAQVDEFVPQKCRTAAAGRAADLDYTDQVERPAELFRRRSGSL